MAWKIGTPLGLRTDHYVLRSIDPSNIPDEFVDWFADPEVMKFMNDRANLNKEQLSNLFARYNNRTRIALQITDIETSKVIGIFRIYIESSNRHGHTSILIGDKDFWGKSVAIEVRERVLKFLFLGFELQKVCGYVRARNFPALFNYQKQHFKKEGIRKLHMRNNEGEFDDVVEFALFRDDWMAQHNITEQEA